MSDTYGLSSLTPFARYDRNSHSLRMCEDILPSVSTRSLGTVPARGLMCDGRLYELPMLGHRTTDHDCLPLLPTPLSSDWKRGNHAASLRRRSPELPVVDAHFPVIGSDGVSRYADVDDPSLPTSSDDMPTLF